MTESELNTIADLQSELAERRKAAVAALPVASDATFNRLVSEYKTNGTTLPELNSLDIERDEDDEPVLDENNQAQPLGFRLSEKQEAVWKRVKNDRKAYLSSKEGREYVGKTVRPLTCTRFSVRVKADGGIRANATYEKVAKKAKKKKNA